MHEFGLCEGIVDAVVTRAAGRPVTGVRVRVGALHRVAEPALAHAFEVLAAGTVAESASIDVVVVPVEATCGLCGFTSQSDDAFTLCARCGGTDVRIEGGDELILESIRLAAPV